MRNFFLISFLIFCLSIFFSYLTEFLFLITIEIHFALLSLALFFVYHDIHKFFVYVNTLKGLFFSVLHGIGLFFILILITLGILLGMDLLDIRSDTTNIYQKVLGFPFYLLVFAVLLAPISEELFFRAFLASRYGIIISSIVFAVAHVFYNSIFEIIGAFFIGLALSYYFVKKSNLIACIIAHLLYNLTSIIFTLQN